MSDKDIGDQMSDLMKSKVREVKAEGLSGNVKVLSRRALMDIVDQMIQSYGGLEHQELISKIAELEIGKKQYESRIASLEGKLEIYEKQYAEIRNEDVDLKAKLKTDEARLPMLEEQAAVLKKTVEGMEAEIENLRGKIGMSEEEAKAALADAAARAAEVDEARKAVEDAERRLKDRDAMACELQEKLESTLAGHEKAFADAREKISRLEKALQESDARKRILELENELSAIKDKLAVLDLGLEFVDVEFMPGFDAVEREIRGLEETLETCAPSGADSVRASIGRIRKFAESEKTRFDDLSRLMYENNGSISVACEMGKIIVRSREVVDELRALKRTIDPAAA